MQFDVSKLWKRLGEPAIIAVVLFVLVGCAGAAPSPVPHVDVNTPAAAGALGDGEQRDPNSAYRLGSGDKLRIIVFAEEDLSGEFEVDGTGHVSLPLIGQIRARGRTLRSFENAVEEMLRDGYLLDPRVNAEVLNHRPFYIIGEVKEGGEYPFSIGMHVLNAIAMAGGYTYRANSSQVYITRQGQQHEFPATPETLVEPGDVIRVPERFF